MTNPWGPGGPQPPQPGSPRVPNPPAYPPQQPGYQHFPQQPYRQPYPPYPQQQLAYPPLPPRRSRAGLVVALIVVAALAVGGVVVLILAPWSSPERSSAPSHETVMLAHGVGVDVDVPAGWRVETGTYDGDEALMILPDDEDRSMARVFADIDTMDDGGLADEVHAVIGFTDACGSQFASLDAGEWDHDTENETSGDARFVAHRAVTAVDGTYCFGMTGVDYGAASSTLGSDGADLVQQLIDDDAITAATAA
ncbi:hypothetical protein [Gordonia humi]|uniref:Uncharacterized protein n=1 Tax=Gordonia humi TaxID=686429 RepID=A0A840ES99_9ACTN|nr:hypothetical protein [Gordonia humi]MBB4134441.1 hypothetical protein [Gordonia humi]